MMAKILVVYHSLSGNTKAMAEAIAKGAREVARAKVTVKTGLEATIDDLLACDGVAVGSPDYFSYMAGGLKDFFDRTYYPSQGKVTGKPCACFGSAGGPPTVVLELLEKMCGAFKMRVIGSVGCSGAPSADIVDECKALGQKLAQAAAS
jgi:multimeric flavodoxin WrbA